MRLQGQHWCKGETMADEYGITALTDPADVLEIEAAYEKAYQSAVARGYTGLYENLAPWEGDWWLKEGTPGAEPASSRSDWWRKKETSEPAPSYQNIFILAVAALVIYALVK